MGHICYAHFRASGHRAEQSRIHKSCPMLLKLIIRENQAMRKYNGRGHVSCSQLILINSSSHEYSPVRWVESSLCDRRELQLSRSQLAMSEVMRDERRTRPGSQMTTSKLGGPTCLRGALTHTTRCEWSSKIGSWKTLM